jgi:hypothetical protein
MMSAGVFSLSVLIVCIVSAQSIQVHGGDQSLTLSGGTAGGQMLNVVNTGATLSYKRQNKTSKITVRTVCLGQKFNLDVVATHLTAGVAAPAVSLINGSPAIDLIRDIPKTGAKDQTCRMEYTASATFAQGNSVELSNDNHTITFTIQLQ